MQPLHIRLKIALQKAASAEALAWKAREEIFAELAWDELPPADVIEDVHEAVRMAADSQGKSDEETRSNFAAALAELYDARFDRITGKRWKPYPIPESTMVILERMGYSREGLESTQFHGKLLERRMKGAAG